MLYHARSRWTSSIRNSRRGRLTLSPFCASDRACGTH
jgi:hypothetical protein